MKKKIILFLLVLMSAIKGMAYNEGSKTIKIGELASLRVTYVFRLHEVKQSVSWRISGSSVMRTAGGGTSTYCHVKGISEGVSSVSCTLVVKNTSTNRTYTYSYYWTVNVLANKPTSISLLPSSLTIDEGDETSIAARILPVGSQTTLTWHTSNEGIVAIKTGTNNAITIEARNPGTATISAATDNGLVASSQVTVFSTSPSSVSLPSDMQLTVGDSKEVTASFSPANSRSSITWSSDNEKVATITNGKVTALWPGTATIIAKTKNGLTASMNVKVVEPEFTMIETSPSQGAQDVDVLTNPSLKFSLAISLKEGYSGITLASSKGQTSIQPTTEGSVLAMNPDQALLPNTTYTLSVPKGSINNKWSTAYSSDISFSFTTGALHKLTLSVSETAKYVEMGTKVELYTSIQNTDVYYTLDGSQPSEHSLLYDKEKGIVIDHDITLRAIAYKNGFDTPEIKQQYIISKLNVVDFYPQDNSLYIYKDVNPYVEFSEKINESDEFAELDFYTTQDKDEIEGRFIISGKKLVFVPSLSLERGKAYTFCLAENAIKAKDGEPCAAKLFHFTTGEYTHDIAAEYKNAVILGSDGKVRLVGEYPDRLDDEGTVHYGLTDKPSDNTFADNIVAISSGYMHSLLLDKENSLYGLGEQYCGEMGSSTQETFITPHLLKENIDGAFGGGQGTAYVSEGSLYMLGRNDEGQIANPTDTYYFTPQDKALSNVKMVAPALTSTFAVTESGDLYGWGCLKNGLLLTNFLFESYVPNYIMGNIKYVAASKFADTNAAAITNGGSLLTWGRNDYGQLGNGNTQPVNVSEASAVLENVATVAVGTDFMAAITNDGSLWTWGNNSYGQLGLGSTGGYYSTPQKVMDSVTKVEIGGNQVYAIKDDGSLWQWGIHKYIKINESTGFEETAKEYANTPTLLMAGMKKSDLLGISLDETEIHIQPGEEYVVSAKPQPLNANYQQYDWSISDSEIASVDSRGVVKGLAEGETILTLTADGANTALCKIIVKNEIPSSIEMPSVNPAFFDVYSLDGKIIKRKATDYSGLRSGVYIINGKKVTINK